MQQLLPQVYDELRRLAAWHVAKEQPGQTLQATALVHEAYLRLVGNEDPLWNGRRHFFGAAGETAVNFAEQAIAATEQKDSDCLETLAAADAETHPFHKAISTQGEAVALSPEGQLKKNRKVRLVLYRSNSPFREARLEDGLFWKAQTKSNSTNRQTSKTPQ